MGKRKRDDSMEKSKEEKNRVLKDKFEELQHHQYWNYSGKLHALCLINKSPRKLMSSLQTRSLSEEKSLSSKACSVCSDCFENEECDEEEVRSVVVSSASVHEIYENNQGPGEMTIGTNTNVKNAGKFINVGWEFSVLIIGLVIAALLSVHCTWYVDQDLDQVLLPPT